MSKPQKSRKTGPGAELLPDTVAIPEGTKQVQRTTVERFTAPAREDDARLADAEADDYEPSELEEEPTNGHAELDPLDPDDSQLSPVERLLLDLRQRTGSIGPVVIYAKRKPDPVGMTFRNPCNAEKTVGEVPYDENDLSLEALELSVQKLYGGGRYQILVRRNGDYAGAITRNIADPPEKAPEVNGASGPSVNAAPPVSPTPPRSPLDEVRSSVEIVKEVAQLLNSTRPAQDRALPPPPAPDPLETMKGAIDLVQKVNSFTNPVSSGGGEASTVRDWTEGLAGIARELQIGPMLNNLLIFGLRAAEKKQAEEEAARAQQGQASATVPLGPTAAQPSPTPPAAFPPLRAVDQPQPVSPPPLLPGGLSVEQLPPPLRVALDQALTVVVSELKENETSEAEEISVDAAVEALEKFLQLFPAAVPMFDKLMAQSSVQLVVFLSAFKPEWSNLMELQSAAGFLDELKAWWNELKEAPDDENEEERQQAVEETNDAGAATAS